MTIYEAIDYQFSGFNVDTASARQLDDIHAARGIAMVMMAYEKMRRLKEAA